MNIKLGVLAHPNQFRIRRSTPRYPTKTDNKLKKKIHIFCSERIPKIISYFEEFAKKNIWQHAYFIKGIDPPPPHLPPISTLRS